MKCPNCGSDNIVVLSESESQGYGVGKGCLGFICLGGPIGLICGLCGMGKTKTKHYAKCMNCDKTFSI